MTLFVLGLIVGLVVGPALLIAYAQFKVGEAAPDVLAERALSSAFVPGLADVRPGIASGAEAATPGVRPTEPSLN